MSTDRPNVPLITTDQHRHDLMTCVGDSIVPTRNIDRIAHRGVRFANAYLKPKACSTIPSSSTDRPLADLTGTGAVSADELYDLINDLEENTNRAADPGDTALCRDLRSQLFDWFDPQQNQFRKTPL